MKVVSQKPAFGNIPGESVHVDRKRVVFDRGMVLPGAGQEPVIAAHHPALVIDTRSELDNFPLRDVRNDTKSRAYCGPTAIAAITGAPISMVRDAYRLVRFGGEWIYRHRAPAIIGTTYAEAEKVLRLLGFVGFWHHVDGAPTFAAYMQMRKGMQRTNASILFVTRHAVAISGWQFCDTLKRNQCKALTAHRSHNHEAIIACDGESRLRIDHGDR
ncbi:hypothetical protein [Mesorhizobium sp. A623]